MTAVVPAVDKDELNALSQRFESAAPQEIVAWAMERFGSGLAIAASFGGASGMAILHMAAQINPGVFAFVIDTDYLFEETHENMRRSVAALGLTNVNTFKSRLTHEEQSSRFGAALWMRDPDQCCEVRKVEPNVRALEGKTAWVSGLRRDQSEGRAETPILSWNDKFGLVKINPLATWDEKQTWAYMTEHGVPYNELLDHGYSSIGCYNCTIPGVQGRAGRWAGLDKDECGLHT